MTSVFLNKVKAFFDLYFKSFQSQSYYIFSYYAINKYGYCLQIRMRYYQPGRMSEKVSIKLLKRFNEALKNKKIIPIFSSLQRNQMIKIKVESEITRIISPAIDSSILAQFLAHMAERNKFQRICFKVYTKMIHRTFSTRIIEERTIYPLRSADPVLGLELRIHGRIPKDPVRPRKTVQTRIVGRRSLRHINKNPIQINRAQGVNPALGAFSV